MKSRRRAFLITLVALPLVPPGASSANAWGAPPPAAPPGGGLFEGLLAAARTRYRLAPDEVDDVRKGIELVLGAADQIRAVPLVNSDEPVLAFQARPFATPASGRSLRPWSRSRATSLSPRRSLPTSVQLLGRAFSEGVPLAIGDRFQAATDWRLLRPPIARA